MLLSHAQFVPEHVPSMEPMVQPARQRLLVEHHPQFAIAVHVAHVVALSHMGVMLPPEHWLPVHAQLDPEHVRSNDPVLQP
jgi:hypothetical protein